MPSLDLFSKQYQPPSSATCYWPQLLIFSLHGYFSIISAFKSIPLTRIRVISKYLCVKLCYVQECTGDERAGATKAASLTPFFFSFIISCHIVAICCILYTMSSFILSYFSGNLACAPQLLIYAETNGGKQNKKE